MVNDKGLTSMPYYDFGKLPKLDIQIIWSNRLALIGQSDWSRWEKDFYRSVSLTLKLGKQLTEAQIYYLETLYAKYTN